MKYSESRMVWFAKVPVFHQPILTFPMIGYISAYQALIIFLVGLPALFITAHVTGEFHNGIIPFLGIAAFAMMRPPLISYEGRLAARLKFMMSGKGGKRSAPKKRGRFLAVPSPGVRARPVQRTEEGPMLVKTTGERMMKIEISLRTEEGRTVAGRRVVILLDGAPVSTTVSSDSGRVQVYLEREECAGERVLTVADAGHDGAPGDILLTKELVFAG